MGWQWHQSNPMHIICMSLHTDNNTSTSSLSFLWASCSSCHPTNSVIALKTFRVFHNQPIYYFIVINTRTWLCCTHSLLIGLICCNVFLVYHTVPQLMGIHTLAVLIKVLIFLPCNFTISLLLLPTCFMQALLEHWSSHTHILVICRWTWVMVSLCPLNHELRWLMQNFMWSDAFPKAN